MANAAFGRISLGFMAGIALAALSVALLLGVMARRQNDEARAMALATVERSLDAMTDGAREAAAHYALHFSVDDGLEGGGDLVPRVGSLPAGVDRLFVSDLGGRASWSVSAERNSPLPHALSQQAVVLSEAFDPITWAAPVAYAIAEGEIFLVSAARLRIAGEAASAEPIEEAIVAAAVHLDDVRLAEIGAAAGVHDLRLELGSAPSDSSFPALAGVDGTLGRVVWSLPEPGSRILRGLLLPAGAILLMLSAVGGVAAVRAQRALNELGRREQAALAAVRTDLMTDLPNRDGFTEILASPLVTEASKLGQLGIVYLDVKGFKGVNDSIGHRGGDELIRLLADRLSSVLPPGAVMARIGGAEFAALLSGSNIRETIAGAAAALVHALDEPFLVAGFEFHITAAVGYAVATRAGMAPSEILRRADLAMYQAKAAAEREAVAYHATMESGAVEKKRVEVALRRAIELGELTVVYQPIVRTADLTMASLEALVRWDSAEYGTITPGLFVPIAEESGLIHEVGSFVVHRVCQDLARWSTDLTVSINISPAQLREPNFATDLVSMVERSGARPEAFEIEVTEGLLVSNPAIAKRKLELLKKLGFGLSLDDFGTGFSSIGYLRQFPFTKLKVDRSFVREIGVSATANALIQAIVSLGDALDIPVVAEGVENEEQLSLLRLLQCEFLQGYYVSRPITAEQVASLLEEGGQERPRIRLDGESAGARLAALSA